LPELFIPRYSMVMFHDMPYSEALGKGEIQSSILDELVEGIDSVDDVNWEQAEAMMKRSVG